jgi:hypothetical protein
MGLDGRWVVLVAIWKCVVCSRRLLLKGRRRLVGSKPWSELGIELDGGAQVAGGVTVLESFRLSDTETPVVGR